MTDADLRIALREEFAAIEGDIMYAEKAHFDLERIGARTHSILGLTAAIASAIAAATILRGAASWIPGSAAVVATVASAMLTFVRPSENAQKHLGAGNSLGALRVLVRQTANLDLTFPALADLALLRVRVGELSAAKAEIDRTAPAISERSFRHARRKIKRGDFVRD